MTDIKTKCTRCKHVCMSSEWVDVPSKRFSGCTEKTCPRCGCRSWYDMTPQVAWCFASGEIEVGDEAPAKLADGSGAIVFAKGPKYALKDRISAVARHGYQPGVLLVPGVPEAKTSEERINALHAFVVWCGKGRKRDGVTFE